MLLLFRQISINMPAHGPPPAPGANKDAGGAVDPFTRKSSVKKIVKGQKKQQGSSRFRNKPNVEIQPLALLKG